MRFTAAWLVVLLCAPRLTSQASDKNPPEALLPSTCIAYFRYDGYEKHKKSYDKTALGKAMKDDLGEALEYTFGFFDDLFAASIPAWKNNREAAHACLAGLWKNGVVLGLELAEESDWRLTIVLPQGINPPYRHVLPQVAKALEQYEADPLVFKPRTINERKVHEAKNKKDVSIAWWYESPHAVVTIGTLPPEDVIAIADGTKPNFTGHRDYRRMAEFKAYETDIRGFVDLKGVIERACARTKKSEDWSSWYDVLVKRALCYRSGLFGLETATVHLGFDGKYQRSTVKVHVVEPAKRVGLLKLPGAGLTGNGKIDAWPIPPDAASVAIRHIAWQRVTDEWLALAQIAESWTVLNEWRNRGLRSIFFPGLSDIGKLLAPKDPAADEKADVSKPNGSNLKAAKVYANHGFFLHGDSNDYMRMYTPKAKNPKQRPALMVIYEPKT